ncbi:hypothetical protein DERP_006417 [Dermatophagoides pteronyssinus]|uniref:Uncharacterized protein n=1 Tax=Dermatophagoides pteronyssinus TaxID=6956 RepID=A0ABQ8IQ32_DERPT|nr:hypothetical protein DERP_006417 [Dermatophagoides pteronyssinus]
MVLMLPICAKKKPRLELCGSAFKYKQNTNLNGHFALYERCDQRRCAPAVIPNDDENKPNINVIKLVCHLIFISVTNKNQP